LEDQNVADFEFKKLQSRKRSVLISFEDGASFAMKLGQESNIKTTNPNTMPVLKNRGRDDGASWRVKGIRAGHVAIEKSL